MVEENERKSPEEANSEEAQTPVADANDSETAEETAEETKAPVNEICENAEEMAASLADDDSDVKPVEGFFLTSQRWH